MRHRLIPGCVASALMQMEDGRRAEDFAHSVYQQICDGYGTIQKSPSPGLDRLHGSATRSTFESEMSDRAASPFTASIAGSDYCQSAAGEVDLGSSADGDTGDDRGMPSPCEDEMDEDDEDDLSSEPPPQRSDGVSLNLLCAHCLLTISFCVQRNGNVLEMKYAKWRLALLV